MKWPGIHTCPYLHSGGRNTRSFLAVVSATVGASGALSLRVLCVLAVSRLCIAVELG
jgi:hypothetical protein